MTIRGPFAVALAVLLFVSLAANFVVAGFTLARIAGPRPPSDIERIFAIGLRDFPPEIRQAIGERVSAGRDQLRARINAIEAARQRMFEAMRAQPFDSAALEAAFADLRAETVALQQAGQGVVAAAIADAPPEMRRNIRPPRYFGP